MNNAGGTAEEAAIERGPGVHILKCWPEVFGPMLRDLKKHEIREADRDFRVGDFLFLCEWNPSTISFTGASVWRRVTYLTRGGDWGIPEHKCVMSIEPAVAREACEYPEIKVPHV